MGKSLVVSFYCKHAARRSISFVITRSLAQSHRHTEQNLVLRIGPGFRRFVWPDVPDEFAGSMPFSAWYMPVMVEDGYDRDMGVTYGLLLSAVNKEATLFKRMGIASLLFSDFIHAGNEDKIITII